MWKFLLAAVVIAGVATIPSIALASQPSTDRDCGDFSSRNEMMSFYNNDPDDSSNLDDDNDGFPCETQRFTFDDEPSASGDSCVIGGAVGTYVDDPSIPESDALLCDTPGYGDEPVEPVANPVTEEVFTTVSPEVLDEK